MPSSGSARPSSAGAAGASSAAPTVATDHRHREHSANISDLTGFDLRFEEAVLVVGADGDPAALAGNECNERSEPVVGSTPPEVPPVAQDPTQVHIVEATQPVPFTDVPVAPGFADIYSDPTTVVPVQAVPVHAVQPVAYAPVPPVYTEERFIHDERRPARPYIAAVVALLFGGPRRYLIGASGEDEATPAAVTAPAGDTAVGDVASTFDMLLARTRADGAYKSPSEYPQLDEITAIDNAAATKNLQTQVETLTIAQGEAKGLTDKLAILEVAVAELTAERDTLAAQVAGNGGTNSDMQAQLDDANFQIATLTADLATVRSELDTANASLRTAPSDLAAANAAYDALDVMPAPDDVKADIARVRTEAAANGWTLIEQATNSTSALLDGWLGYQKMALMLEEMLPPGAVAKTVPGMLIPQDFHAAEALTSGSARVNTKLPTGVPEVALALKAYDGSFPLLSSDEIGRACGYLAQAHTRIEADYVDRDPRYVNLLTKLARDLAQAEGAEISRGQLGYIATALRFGGWLFEDLTAQAIRLRYAEFVLNRFASLGLVRGPATPEAEAVRRWLAGESPDL